MKNLVFLAVLLAAAFVGVGMYQGWFAIEKVNDGKSTHISVQINNEGFAKGKEEFLKGAQDRLRDLAGEIDKLRGQTPASNTPSSGFAGNATAGDADDSKALNLLLEKQKVVERQIDDVRNANSDNFAAIKDKTNNALDDLKTGYKGASERFHRRRNRP